MNTESVG